MGTPPAINHTLAMTITIKRRPGQSADGYTHGQLYIDESGFLCWTLEDTDRGLTADMPLEEIKRRKVYGQTAIPKGTYRIHLRVSPSLKDRSYAQPYGGKFPVIINVPGYSGCMLHPGNTPEDTRGCILPGMLRQGIRGRVFDSTKAYRDLMDFYIWPAYKRGEQIWLTIE